MDTQELQAIKNRYDIIGNDSALNRAIETAIAVAPTDLTVLICGESGSGKDIFPRMIHQHSRRKTADFMAINCGGIPEGTINSELFGHVKGSFTGADRDHKGYFETVNGGTLFLDEIGELPPATQAMLLRVLQNGEYMKVGSSKVEKTDVRIIAATNVNLLHAVSQGKFRADLYYRLNGIQIDIPALRDRRGDIHLLFRKFSSDFSERNRTPRIALTHSAIALLTSYRWPGNVRQLQSLAGAVTLMATKDLDPSATRCEVNAEILSQYMPSEGENALAVIDDRRSGLSDDDRQIIIKAILDMKQEIDALKRAVYGRDTAMAEPQAVLPPPATHETEDDIDEQPQEQAFDDGKEESLDLQDNEKALIEKALIKYDGHRKKAAQELGFAERTLYRKMKKYGLE